MTLVVTKRGTFQECFETDPMSRLSKCTNHPEASVLELELTKRHAIVGNPYSQAEHTIASTGARSIESGGTVGETAWSEVFQNLTIFANATMSKLWISQLCSTKFYEVFKGVTVVILEGGYLHLKLIYQGRLWRGFPRPSCPHRRLRHRRRLT